MEFIGLAIGTTIMRILACFFGAVVASGTWIVLRPFRLRIIPLLATSVLLPPACVVWLLFTMAALPHESLFGDIDEGLPNDYTVQALGKMPSFATIQRKNSSSFSGLTEYVGSVQVQGDLVAGQYSHSLDSFEPHPNERFFLLNTLSGIAQNFDSPTELAAHLTSPLQLTPVPLFHSTEPEYRYWRTVGRDVTFGPMIIAWLSYVAIVVWIKQRAGRGRKQPIYDVQTLFP